MEAVLAERRGARRAARHAPCEIAKCVEEKISQPCVLN
jgi:hypothetical protein